jgi:hypothetical protein
VASPGTGYREISLGASVEVQNGDFFFLSTNNGTITFATNWDANAASSALGLGFTMYAATGGFPAPGDNPTITDGLDGWTVGMVGVT